MIVKALNKPFKVSFVCLNTFVLTTLLFSSAILAQTSAPPSGTDSVDAIIKRLEDEKKRLELEAANLKLREANLSLERKIQELDSTPIIPNPSPDSNPNALPDNTFIGKSDFPQTIESTILAYESMGLIAKEISDQTIKKLQENDIQNVVIDNGKIKAALILHSIYTGQIIRLRDMYKTEFAQPGVSAPAALDLTALTIPSTVLRTIIDFVALFRSKDKIFVQDIAVDDNTLAIKLGSEFNNQKLTVFYPDVNLINLESLSTNFKEGFLGEFLVKLLNDKFQATQLILQYEEEIKKLEAIPAKKGKLTTRINRLKEINTEVDTLIANLTRSTDEESPPILFLLEQAQEIKKLLLQENTVIVNVDIVKSGGSIRTRDSLFTTMFTGKRVAYSGGLIVSYVIFNPNGSIMVADVLSSKTGFRRMGQDFNNFDKVKR
jgi:cell division protein FtsB